MPEFAAVRVGAGRHRSRRAHRRGQRAWRGWVVAGLALSTGVTATLAVDGWRQDGHPGRAGGDRGACAQD
ncbi:hypothetical protein [Streptomyces sp. NPDC005438]|uniref:hypothetical protein n=1 Tax=Streptomyces sp. NPDC005438 TaxID=3156880 RepID=UPI0033BC53A6